MSTAPADSPESSAGGLTLATVDAALADTASEAATAKRRGYGATLARLIVEHVAAGESPEAAKILAEGELADQNHEASMAETEAVVADLRLRAANDDLDDAILLTKWQQATAARRDDARSTHRHRPRARRSRGCSGRTRGSRRGSSSRSAGGGSSGSDDPDESEPPGLRLWRHPHFGSCSPALLRVLIGAGR